MAIHSSKPFPLTYGPIEMTMRERDVATGKSAIVKPIEVGASSVPHWLAQIAHVRFVRLNNITGRDFFTLDDIERNGGLLPLTFLDLLAAGDGRGQKWMWLESRRAALVDQSILEVPLFEHPTNVSTAPFPVQGSRVDDGTGMEPGFIPEWFASLLVRRYNRWRRGEMSERTIESVKKSGGLTPIEVLDLSIGGRGDGLGHRIVEKHWNDTAAMTDIESQIIKDADAAPQRSVIARDSA